MAENSSGREMKEVAGELMGMQSNQLFNTIKGLTHRPGLVVKAYSSGKRGTFLSPVIYFFGLMTLEYLVTYVTGYRDYFLQQQILEIQEAFASDENLSDGDVARITEKMGGFVGFIVSEMGQKLLALPVMLVLVSLIYIKQKKGFKTNSWLALYAFGHVKLVTIPLTLLWLAGLPMVWLVVVSFVVSLLYWIYATKDFYGLSIVRSVLMGIVFYLVYLLFFTLIGGIAGLYIGLTVGLSPAG